MDDRWHDLESASGLSIARDVSLRRFSSLGIGGFAAGAATVENEKTLEKLLTAASSAKIPVKMIGGGTNVVFPDTGFPGLLVRLGDGFKKIEIEGTTLRAGAAVHLTALITRSLEAGLSGVEKLAGVPGSLGGAIYQNSGARDFEISLSVGSVTFWDIARKTLRTWPREKLQFKYRESVFQTTPSVILSAELELKSAEREKLMEEVNTRMKHRAQTQPTGRSIGCIFKNPGGRSAGQMIEEAGLKGRRVGGIAVSDIHGNFFLNDGRATFGDFEELVGLVRTEVEKKFGMSLELEVEIVREKEEASNVGKGAPEKSSGGAFRENAENSPLRRWKISGEGNFL